MVPPSFTPSPVAAATAAAFMLPPALWPYLCNLPTTPAGSAVGAATAAASNAPSDTAASSQGRPPLGYPGSAVTTTTAGAAADHPAESMGINSSRPLMGFNAATAGAAATPSVGAAPPDSTLIPATPSVPFAIPLPSNLKLAQDPVNGTWIHHTWFLPVFASTCIFPLIRTN